MPQVSVVVPVHNTASFLPRCVESLTSQRLSDIEIILVENCSTDNSLEVCHMLAEEDSRIKVISIDKGDPSIARTEGVKVASGEYIGFVDSDDFVSPEMYGDMYNLAVEHDLGLVSCTFHMVYDDGSEKYRMPNDGSVRILSAKEITILNLQEKVSRVLPTLLVRKDLLEGINFPVGVFYEDRATTHLIMARSGRAAAVNRAYYKYYSRRGSRMHDKSVKYRRMRDFIVATYARINFVATSEMFTNEERPFVMERSANQYLRKLRHLLCYAKSEEERTEAKEWCRKIDEIPQQTHLSFKARAIGWYIRKFVI